VSKPEEEGRRGGREGHSTISNGAEEFIHRVVVDDDAEQVALGQRGQHIARVFAHLRMGKDSKRKRKQEEEGQTQTD
jgi:hypothetical protein